ncbi:hypothetical protein N2152v2_009992 [Parachlorella kessleri]
MAGAEEDDYADQLGVINALERTCELEAKLRQAIQDTHPLTTTLDWDFHAADRERDALLAIGEQLEFLEDKLREYRNLDAREEDNKAVVLAQLDNVRRELVEVTQNRMGHVTFGKEVVKEVLSFANLSDGGGAGAGPDSNGHGAAAGGAEQEDYPYPSYGDAHGTAVAAQSPQPPHARPASGYGRRSASRTSGGGAAARNTVLPPSPSYLSYGEGREGGAGHQIPGRKANSEHGDRIRAFAALMSPNSRRTDGLSSPGASTLFSPGGTAADPRSGNASPYGGAYPSQQQAAQQGRASGAAAAAGRPPAGAAAGAAGAPRRQINLDLAAINTSAAAAGRGAATANGSAYGAGRASASPPASARFPSTQPGSAPTASARDRDPGSSSSYYYAPSRASTEPQGPAAGWGWGHNGGSSRPSSARGPGANSSSYSAGQSGAGGGAGGRGGEVGSSRGLLTRLDPPPRVRSASPISLRSEDIYGAVNGAGSGSASRIASRAGNDDYGGIIRLREMVYGVGGAGVGAATGDGSSAGSQQQGEYGGMVRIRDMLDRAEKDLTKVQEEREQRRSPVPARIFGDNAGRRYSTDGEDRPARSVSSGPGARSGARSGGTGYSPPRASRHKPSIVDPAPSAAATAGLGYGGVEDSPYDHPSYDHRGARSEAGGNVGGEGGRGGGGEAEGGAFSFRGRGREREASGALDGKRGGGYSYASSYAAYPVGDPAGVGRGAYSAARERERAARGAASSSGAHVGGGEDTAGRAGKAGAAVAGALGWLARRLAVLTMAAAGAALGAAAAGTAAQWSKQHLPGRLPSISLPKPKKSKQRAPSARRDLPPWLAPSLEPPPGSPQRSRAANKRPQSGSTQPPGTSASAAEAQRYAGAAGGIWVPVPPGGAAAAPPARRQPSQRQQQQPKRTADLPPLPQLHQSPVIHVHPLPAGDLFPSMPPPDVNVAKG